MKAKILNCKEGRALQHGRAIISCSSLFSSLQKAEESSRALNTDKSQVQKEVRDADYADQIIEHRLHTVYYHCAPQVCINSLTTKKKHFLKLMLKWELVVN